VHSGHRRAAESAVGEQLPAAPPSAG
jgi:hypothetical protein